MKFPFIARLLHFPFGQKTSCHYFSTLSRRIKPPLPFLRPLGQALLKKSQTLFQEFSIHLLPLLIKWFCWHKLNGFAIPFSIYNYICNFLRTQSKNSASGYHIVNAFEKWADCIENICNACTFAQSKLHYSQEYTKRTEAWETWCCYTQTVNPKKCLMFPHTPPYHQKTSLHCLSSNVIQNRPINEDTCNNFLTQQSIKENATEKITFNNIVKS